MSKYHEYESTFKDRDCLVGALNDQGYATVEIHDVAQNLTGYHGDRRQEKANVIVRRVHVGPAANDLGFVKKPDGTFAAIVSEFDSGKHDTSWFNGLKRAYTERVTLKTAAKSGFRFLGKKIVAGKVQLQFMDPRSGQ